MSWIVQVTAESSITVLFCLKIDTNTIMFLITEPLAFSHIPYSDVLYCVVHEAFVREEKKIWERQRTTRNWKSQIINNSEQNVLHPKGNRTLLFQMIREQMCLRNKCTQNSENLNFKICC